MTVPIRKTRKRFEHLRECRFLTFSCYQRLPLFNNDRIKDAFVEHLRMTRETTHFQLFAYVVMPEHVHLMLIPALPDWPMPRVLRHIKGAFAHHVLQRWKELQAPVLSRLQDRQGNLHFWQTGGGYDRNVHSDAEYQEKIEYMHNNPVKRGLVPNPLEWKWSSAQWYSGSRENALALDRIAH